ncbi:hypothetical protein BDK51DRAFT_48986 [Blyttiomyces helicus]|uniref:F-box domain-containing protein n=1 Tax=Blyttiomyces helicus TaxID=388810 RepID=A0A4P9W078_9FUNG|nr:hypothetical protein BDK51DRAFT_48986 [Blyttiomyces helicus]|eukprot:RKO84493.1 hypothetical protein BDK51DRAFT_48986 [Blyttiomyces helicus]
MFADLRALNITRDCMIAGLGVVTSIFGACDHLVAVIWIFATSSHASISLHVNYDQLATIKKGVERLVLFQWQLWGIRRLAEARMIQHIEVVGPQICQWTDTGQEDVSSLVPGACQNLEFLCCHNISRQNQYPWPGITLGFFISLTALAPSLRKVCFTSRALANDHDIINLVTAFPAIEELDLCRQHTLTDAALAPLELLPTVEILGI